MTPTPAQKRTLFQRLVDFFRPSKSEEVFDKPAPDISGHVEAEQIVQEWTEPELDPNDINAGLPPGWFPVDPAPRVFSSVKLEEMLNNKKKLWERVDHRDAQVERLMNDEPVVIVDKVPLAVDLEFQQRIATMAAAIRTRITALEAQISAELEIKKQLDALYVQWGGDRRATYYW